MPSQTTLTFYEYNDETVTGTLYEDVARTIPLDLTGATVEFIYKTSVDQEDTEATIVPCTVVSALDGTIEVEIDNSLVRVTRRFFRIDVVVGGERKTTVYGPVQVVDL
jgi:hypothetical protein